MSSSRVQGFGLVRIKGGGKRSLRSKRFRVVREQRKSEKRDFRCFARAKNGARAKKRKEREGEGKEVTSPSFPSPNPLFRFLALAPFFAREKHLKSRSSVFLCSQTPRKRLLRRLRERDDTYFNSGMRSENTSAEAEIVITSTGGMRKKFQK